MFFADILIGEEFKRRTGRFIVTWAAFLSNNRFDIPP
jgi:hypothetical protein